MPPERPPLSDADIERLLPHRGPMKLIDGITAVDETGAATTATVRPDWPLVADGAVSPLVLIEVAAQSSAISIGWKELVEKGDIAGNGWLVGVKSAVFHVEAIPVGTVIHARADVAFSMDNFTEIHARTRIGDAPAGEITLQVMRAEEGEGKQDG